MAIALLHAGAARAIDDGRLPVTVAERLSACAEVEDTEPARAVALADSVLSEPVPAAPAQRAEAL
ncbi:MAG: hypothetical protein J0L88_08710, partial [Xanthomonadales bacterium]|nr:hypothetical protein [Xanthomonadales bacterium]